MEIILTILAACMVFTAAMAGSYPDGAACLNKHPNIYTATNKFCTASDTVVPSAYTNAGKSHNGKWVGIPGSCNPPQWVPQYYCKAQLRSVCAKAPPNRNNQAYHGRNGCQTFVTWDWS